MKVEILIYADVKVNDDDDINNSKREIKDKQKTKKYIYEGNKKKIK